MSIPSQTNNSNSRNASETSPGDPMDDSHENGKRDSLDPQSLPARNSSLKTSQNRPDSSTKLSRKTKHDLPIKTESEFASADDSPQVEDKPPTPPPKNNVPNSSSSQQ